jgi:hypothetical protein
MRQLLLSAYPPTDESYTLTKYQPILINTQLESPSIYGNRIGSPANQFYYYDSSKGENMDKTGDGSAAAMVHGKKMNDEVDEEEDSIVLLSDVDSETNATTEILGDPTGESVDEVESNEVTEDRP